MPNPNRLRCPECGTRRTDPRAMVLHRLKCVRPVCDCLRVPHPHRPGGFPLCEQNPDSDVLLAIAHGATTEEAMDISIEIALTRPGRRAVQCPF